MIAHQGGKIILINGASSSGKSSIARAVQAKIDEPFWRISFDHLRDSGALPLDRFRSGEFDWASLRERFFIGYERSLAAFAETGNNLIVDYIVETEAGMRRLVDLFARFDVFFVAVHCELDELERRERVRGDRKIGDARRDHETIHRHARYDLELDSTLLPPEANADGLISSWRARTRPSAFDALA
jgi:chloramphenicol 3-O phosphotransferase